MLTIGSLFSGIGGLELGLEWAGLGPTIWQVEKDEFCRKVLAKHWPHADRSVIDVKDAPGDLKTPDIICGGFPCQDISSAGSRKGLAGNRSGLWCEFSRVLKETKPRIAVIENVFSGAHLWVDEVVRELEVLNYEVLPIPLQAADVGAPHLRARVFIVARHADCKTSSVVPVYEKVAGVQGATKAFPPWPKPPSVSMADGIYKELAAVGNAVVPQCSEVIGWVIREIMEI